MRLPRVFAASKRISTTLSLYWRRRIARKATTTALRGEGKDVYLHEIETNEWGRATTRKKHRFSPPPRTTVKPPEIKNYTHDRGAHGGAGGESGSHLGLEVFFGGRWRRKGKAERRKSCEN